MEVKVKNQENIISVIEPIIPELSGLGTTFFYKMLENRDKTAQVDGLTGTKETYGFLLQKSIRTALTMRSKGITSDDIISICSFNSLDSNVPLIASLFLGAKISCLDPSISFTDTVHLINQVKPKMIFVGLEAVQLIEDVIKETRIDTNLVVFGDTSKHMKFADFIKASPEEQLFVPVKLKNIKDTAIIFFSSGTTGLPKGICVSHYGLLGFVYLNNIYVQQNELILTFASVYWISSVMFTAHCIIFCAARLIYPKFDYTQVWNLISKYKVNSMFMAPNQVLNMCKNGRPEQFDTSSLRYVIVGGGPMSASQLIRIRKCLPETIVCKAYGQTELSGGALMFNTSDPEAVKLTTKKPESSGLPVPGCLYKVVNVDTEESLGPNQEGELRIKTRFQMNGYYNIDSSSCFDSDGFIKTGDIAYYDEDYCFYIVDRIKEMLKFQSWHVAPAKIESVLLSHPEVESAVVVGLPDPEDGDHPVGIVVLKQSASTSVTAKEIEAYVEQRVDDRQKLRSGVKIVLNIPVTPTGKINRRQLKELVRQGKI